SSEFGGGYRLPALVTVYSSASILLTKSVVVEHRPRRPVSRAQNLWGVIGELPVHRKLRLVGEVNGESTQAQRPNNSALLGLIWQPTSRNVFLDAGVRRGISHAAPDWQFTIGLTFGFSIPKVSRQ